MSKQVFQDGDPTNNVLGTLIAAAFLNAMQNHRHDGLDQDGSCPLDYATSSGSANAYLLTLTKALTAHIPGLPIRFKTNFANTGAATINISGLGAIAIKKNGSTDLTSGDIVSGRILTIAYDGTYYQLLSDAAANELSSHNASASAHSDLRTLKAWLRYNGSTNTVNGSYNITSVTDNGTGSFTLNFTTAISDANYAALATATGSDTAAGSSTLVASPISPTTTTLGIIVSDNSTDNVFDPLRLSVAIYR